ncbi:hypothetical protein NYR70_08630 [Actinobacillus equuli subsp. equuli]|uniref:hypothetical protein n=1 Tax=Actinobacillus equuli TaxID=718 RepID=UPI0024188506|nr:hypothetical protein [Actinobacillus equuli]MDG4953183.1 hypothetical protein [Actinobacillus equuli subsp. equuli]WGE54690.1 hypothetical protein NYR70_08630 [Actinobacillus equuli subsp. equuli]
MDKQFDREELQNKLGEAGAVNPCHRCGNLSFSILDGFSAIRSLQQNISELNGLVIGGSVVPIIYVVCQKCGAITPHAVGALGLLNPKGKPEDK